MLLFIARRVGWSCLVVVAVLVLGFALLNLLPGDPVLYLLPEAADPRHYAEIKQRFGLDRPVLERFWVYLGEIARGNLGSSLSQQRPVAEAILERIPATLMLAAAALTVALAGPLLGLLLGYLAPRHARMERASFLLLLLLTGLPPFLTGLVLILVFSLQLGILPSQGMFALREAREGFSQLGDALAHVILPGVTLGIQPLAALARTTKARVTEIFAQDFVRTARAKGLGETVILLVHVFKNAMPAPIAMLGTSGGHWVGGAVITETLFAWPGVGRLAVEAVLARDYALLLGVMMVSAVAVVLANMVADLLIAMVDPRVRRG